MVFYRMSPNSNVTAVTYKLCNLEQVAILFIPEFPVYNGIVAVNLSHGFVKIK